MKELDYISEIQKTLTNSSYIGDDCAYLEEFEQYITHDTLVEDVHFSLFTTTPYLLGRKSVAVNLSDLSAALCEPKYITVSLSLPSNIKKDFVKELYKGINDTCEEYNVKVIGGDITGSEKVVISICAIGKRKSLFQASRKFAKNGDTIIATGEVGSSACALYGLQNFLYIPNELLNSHNNPKPRIKEGQQLAALINKDTATIDTSDGLLPALFQIAQASQHSIELDYDKLKINKEVKNFCKYNELDEKEFALWGAEDYELIACVDENTLSMLDTELFIPIGKILNKDNTPTIQVKSKDFTLKVDKKMYLEKSFNHFGE